MKLNKRLQVVDKSLHVRYEKETPWPEHSLLYLVWLFGLFWLLLYSYWRRMAVQVLIDPILNILKFWKKNRKKCSEFSRLQRQIGWRWFEYTLSEAVSQLKNTNASYNLHLFYVTKLELNLIEGDTWYHTWRKKTSPTQNRHFGQTMERNVT